MLKREGQFVTAVVPTNFSQDSDVSALGMIKIAAYLALRIITPRFFRPKYSFAVMPKKPDFTSPPLGEEIEALIDSEHPFDQEGVTKAIERVMSHRATGKVLLKVASETPSGAADVSLFGTRVE